ncbi:MAG: gliding motility lipoprotein GldD [Prevotellaceae bacterium]|jgi:gliding motility-associated lipoprotein GldD|nr:gliding motility lipoprotein GldD [Prevotellaceae bacterium]
MKNLLKFFLIFTAVLFFACGKSAKPKPYEYFRIDLPEHKYSQNNSQKRYSFEMSDCAKISSYVGEGQGINIDYQQFNGKIHLTYLPVAVDTFQSVAEECRALAYKHSIKANAIIENYYNNDTAKVYGVLYKITGNAASPVQFFITDSIKHFLRGALYFNNLPNYDSIYPVAEYINQDIVHLIETLRWK